MRRLLLFISLLFGLVSAASAQSYGPSYGWCAVGAVQALTQGLKSTNTLLGIIPYCTVTVYLHGTQTPATIYSNSTGNPLTNPFTASPTGYWNFYADNSAQYDVIGSGGIAPNTYPAPTVITAGGGGGGGASSPPVGSVQYASNTTGSFGSDPCITIDPVAHSFKVCGNGNGLIGIGDVSTGHFVRQVAQTGTNDWTWAWPLSAPSISGACMVANTAGVGFLAGCPINAAIFPGSDIGAKVNAAISSCPATGYGSTAACTVYTPPGNYNFSTQIQVPLNTFSGLKLQFDHGAWLHYTGTSDAIYGYLTAAGPNTNGTIIEGGSLWGDLAGVGANGIHMLPGNQMTIREMQIVDFASGSGILLEGPNQVQIQNNIIQDNKYGIHLIPTFCSGPPYTCGASVSGSQYTVNALHVTGNAITNNLNLGLWDDRNAIPSGTTGTLGNTYDGNDWELNGNTCAGGGVCGAIFIDKSTGSTITHGYFEGSPRQIVLGEVAVNNYFGCTGCNVVENYFTETTATKYLIEAINTLGLQVRGNSTLISTMNSSNCAYNETAFSSGVSFGAQQTVWGPNQIAITGGGNLFCQGGTVVQTMQGAGSWAAVDANYVNQIAYQNFIASSSLTSETIAIQMVSSQSSCNATPRTTAAAGAATGTWIDTYTSGSITLHHPATAGMDFDIWCAIKAPPE